MTRPTLFTNGLVRTLESPGEAHEAIGVVGDKIAFVGSTADGTTRLPDAETAPD